MKIQITPNAFNPWESLQTYEHMLIAQQGKCGAAALFVGTMRDHNEGDSVQSMFLEHYPGMTENYLHKISQEALQQWNILDTLIIHRIGHIHPGDTIVLVAAWAEHRAAAFEACRYLIEELKHRAPFWKQETLSKGNQRWVERNTESLHNP